MSERMITKEMIEAVAWSPSHQEGMPWGMILDDKAIENILSIGLANCAAPSLPSVERLVAERSKCAASGLHDHDGCTCTDAELLGLPSAGEAEPVGYAGTLGDMLGRHAIPASEAQVRVKALQRALQFMAWLSQEPILDSEGGEMTVAGISIHAELELNSIRKSLSTPEQGETAPVQHPAGKHATSLAKQSVAPVAVTDRSVGCATKGLDYHDPPAALHPEGTVSCQSNGRPLPRCKLLPAKVIHDHCGAFCSFINVGNEALCRPNSKKHVFFITYRRGIGGGCDRLSKCVRRGNRQECRCNEDICNENLKHLCQPRHIYPESVYHGARCAVFYQISETNTPTPVSGDTRSPVTQVIDKLTGVQDPKVGDGAYRRAGNPIGQAPGCGPFQCQPEASAGFKSHTVTTSPQQHRNVTEQIADAMQGEPFTDDIHQQGTSQQRMRAMHYANIAVSILAPSPSSDLEGGEPTPSRPEASSTVTGALPLSYGSPGTGIPEPPSPQQHLVADVAKALKPFADEADRLEKLGLLTADLALDAMGNVLTSDFIRARKAYNAITSTPSPAPRATPPSPSPSTPSPRKDEI